MLFECRLGLLPVYVPRTTFQVHDWSYFVYQGIIAGWLVVREASCLLPFPLSSQTLEGLVSRQENAEVYRMGMGMRFWH